MPRFLPSLCLALLWLGASVAPGEDGLFATFVTSRGNFTVQLEHERVPTTVANFVGLAEGTRSWLEESTGRLVRRPFYNGLTFHRVVPGFVIQAGSPNGLGTDGPGYEFGDEFHPALLHDSAGILSMANGGADTNGSQFFITLGPTEHLNSKHSVFGRVFEGMNVVYEIGSGESGATTIERVDISRVGAAALAFDAIGVHGLSEWKSTTAKWAGGNWTLQVEREAFAEHRFLGSETLQSWQYLGRLSDLAEPGSGAVSVSGIVAGRSKYFFRAAKAQYAMRPPTVLGRTLDLHLTSGNQTLQMAFSSAPAEGSVGSYVFEKNPPGVISDFILEHSPAATRLSVALENLANLTFSLKFRTESEGWFTAQQFGATDGYWPLFGTFTVQ